MIIFLHSEAEADLAQAYGYYQSQRAGLGEEFLEEFRRGVDRILEYPGGWQPRKNLIVAIACIVSPTASSIVKNRQRTGLSW